MYRVTIFQHTPEETPGYLETIFTGMKVPYEIVRPYEMGELPDVHPSSLVLLGGPMSVNDEEEYPFLAEEKSLVRDFVRQGFPVLGICLGAQLIASAHGACVSSCTPELGWHPVLRSNRAGPPGFPDRFVVFQMHGETFGIPGGGRLFATGNRVRNQGFLLGSACGIQFHLEMTAELVKAWTSPLEPSLRETLLSESSLYMEESNRLCSLLTSWVLGKNKKITGSFSPGEQSR